MTATAHPTVLRRALALVAAAGATALLATGCSSGAAAPAATLRPATPGVLSVQGPRSHLELTGAKLAGGALTLTVRNEGQVAEHLSMVSTAPDGRATLAGSQGPEHALTSAGVLIKPGETAEFGGAQGPSITFPHPAATHPATVDTILIFSVSGLVHLDTPAG
ncbi:hypothetical protein [Kitasatospora sp. MMS16-BH015]|uniref:hypothetical protein n=1 Tax=Kitasatospora sp. MMS16-BH015 TaxID=2018025 RepID=UPI00131A4A4B|nr:hypothetical protein [Kitasatospora sp. MMS16-BH015]